MSTLRRFPGRALMLLCLVCAGQVSSAPAQAEAGAVASAQAGTEAGTDAAAAVAALGVLDAFMAGFNARDMVAWEATLHFPHLRLADGGLAMLDAPGQRSAAVFERLAATGWHHSAWLSRDVIQAGPDKVHIAVEFARYREDGAELARYMSLYIVTLEQGRWGIRGRSSFAP